MALDGYDCWTLVILAFIINDSSLLESAPVCSLVLRRKVGRGGLTTRGRTRGRMWSLTEACEIISGKEAVQREGFFELSPNKGTIWATDINYSRNGSHGTLERSLLYCKDFRLVKQFLWYCFCSGWYIWAHKKSYEWPAIRKCFWLICNWLLHSLCFWTAYNPSQNVMLFMFQLKKSAANVDACLNDSNFLPKKIAVVFFKLFNLAQQTAWKILCLGNSSSENSWPSSWSDQQ